jgi:chromate reductase
MKPRILLLNGGLGGAAGNTAAVLRPLLTALAPRAEVECVHLATDARGLDALEPLLEAARGFVFSTGTYWDSWGSPLQAFLERATRLEGSDAWLGKPAAVVVTMHSVGGKEVLSRLQGVLCTLGLELPPMTGFAHSLAAQLALQVPHGDHARDLWSLEDLEVVAHNLLEAATGTRRYHAWTVDRGDPMRRWADDAP